MPFIQIPDGRYKAVVSEFSFDETRQSLKRVFMVSEGQLVYKKVTNWFNFLKRDGMPNTGVLGVFAKELAMIDPDYAGLPLAEAMPLFLGFDWNDYLLDIGVQSRTYTGQDGLDKVSTNVYINKIETTVPF